MVECIWDTSTYSQSKLYINLLSEISNGFFGGIKSILLPYPTKEYWYFPNVDLLKNEELWNDIDEISKLSDIKIHNSYTNITKIIKNDFDENNYEFLIQDIDAPLIDKQRKLFEEKFTSIWQYIENTFNHSYTQNIKKIVISPSKFGTNGAFDMEYNNNEYILYINYRLDHFSQITKSLFGGVMLCKSMYYQERNLEDWRDRQAIIDFLGDSDIGRCLEDEKLYKNYATLELLDDGRADKLLESFKYLNQLGYPINSKFTYDDENIYYNQKLISYLSFQEKLFLKQLIHDFGKETTYDDIAKSLWKDEWREKFSFDAINKLAERTRNTLEKNLINQKTILTIRKIGYMIGK